MKVTLKDIAEKAGASLGAVSKALNPDGTSKIRVSAEKVEAILKVARELNYRPNQAARQLAGKASKILGVVLSFESAPIQQERIALLERFAAENGYHLIVSRVSLDTSIEELKEFIAGFISRGIDGLIVIAHLLHGGQEKLATDLYSNLPVIHYGDEEPDLYPYNVSGDTDDGARQVIKHLLDRGYKRIGLALGSTKREQAFVDAVKHHGLATDTDLCWRMRDGVTAQKISIEHANQLIDKLIVEQQVDALVVENDYWGGRVLNICHQRGISVPDDVALVGYSNLEMSELFYPSLTTVDSGNRELAQSLIETLIALIENKQLPKDKHSQTIKPKLIIRETT